GSPPPREPAAEATAGGRLFWFPPAALAGENVGIRRLAVRRTPTAQAMVRVRRSPGPAASAVPPVPARSVTVRVTTAGRAVDRSVDLPAGGGELNLFVDLPAVGGVVTAELVGNDDSYPADDRADVAAEADGPMIEPAVPVGPLQRLIDVYATARLPGERSVHVRLMPGPAGSNDAGTSGEPTVWLAATGGPTAATAGPVRSTAHPIATALGAGADVPIPAAADRLLPSARGADVGGGGWDVVLSDAAGPLVAVRESAGQPGDSPAARQAWVALAPDGWANRVEYVAFWSALFDWVGRADAAGEGMTAHSLDELTPEWRPVDLAPRPPGPTEFWPGVYEREGDGRRRAFGPADGVGTGTTAGDVAGAGRDVGGSLDRWLAAGDRVTLWAPWLLVGATGLVLAAAVTVRGGSLGTRRPAAARASGRPKPAA
ncbi:MAG: hypothetical protein JWO31_2423, partial [Phycisphaerales bacterium]|nr:hypothetical protein [Phycisphaerales bacterium]